MACPKEMKDEALTLIDSLYSNLSDRFGQLFLFEHGVGRLDDVACGINHAHLHFVPLASCNSIAVMNRLKEELGECYNGTVNSLILTDYNKSAYLMFGVSPDKLSIVYSDTIPSQIIRSEVSVELNQQEWSWRQLSGIDEFSKTILLLKDSFNYKLHICEA